MLMSRISKWIVPAGTSTSTRSPFLRPSSAFAIGVPIASLPSRRIRLVLGDDRVGHLLLVVVVQKRHLAQNLHFALVDLRLVDHAGVGHRILQFGDTHLQQPLCLTGGIVLRILRKVALVARFGDRRRNRRTLDGTHVLEFVLDFLVALRCQINNLLCHNPITLRNLPPEAGNSKNRIKRKK